MYKLSLKQNHGRNVLDYSTKSIYILLKFCNRQPTYPNFNHKTLSLKKLHTKNKHIITTSCRHGRVNEFCCSSSSNIYIRMAEQRFQ